MRPIGGELEVKSNEYNIYFTDSGRSSLRLFLKSAKNKNKRYLIPNFFCEVIEKVFIEEKVDYSFYNILGNLEIDLSDVEQKQYDVLYVINYFGRYNDLSKLDLKEKTLIEDNVFFHDFENHTNAKNWFAFNSFRKISSLSDGSLIKTNLPITEENVINKDAPFSSIKYEAKNIKYSYIHNNKFSEQAYLDKFTEAEETLDNQKSIYSISNTSIYMLSTLKSEQNIRKIRFDRLKSIFSNYCIISKASYYSYFVISINDRDGFRRKLMTNNVFLPVHWPESTQKNKLYESIISIPLFGIYSDDEFNTLIEKMKEIL